MGGFQNNLDVWQREFEAEGVKGKIRILEHPGQKAFVVELTTKTPITPMFIEAALYDVAHMIAKNHALVETLRERKRENWD